MNKSLICMGIGAGLMYLLDPEQGEARRGRLCDRLQGIMPETNEALSHKAEAVVARATKLTEKADHVAAETIESLGDEVIKGSGTGTGTGQKS